MLRNTEPEHVFPQILIPRIPKLDSKNRVDIIQKYALSVDISGDCIVGYPRCSEKCLGNVEEEFHYNVKSLFPFGDEVSSLELPVEDSVSLCEEEVSSMDCQSVDSSLVGRTYQRYFHDPVSKDRVRLTAGTVPVRINSHRVSVSISDDKKSVVVKDVPSSGDGVVFRSFEVLCVASSNGRQWILPKGGWETFETLEQGSRRETYEEAGCTGVYIRKEGDKLVQTTQPMACIRYMVGNVPNECWNFTMQCRHILAEYPEKLRLRRWMTAEEAITGMFRVHNQMAVLQTCKELEHIMQEQHLYWLWKYAEKVGLDTLLGHTTYHTEEDIREAFQNQAKVNLQNRMKYLESCILTTPDTYMLPCDADTLRQRVELSGGLKSAPKVLHLGTTPQSI